MHGTDIESVVDGLVDGTIGQAVFEAYTFRRGDGRHRMYEERLHVVRKMVAAMVVAEAELALRDVQRRAGCR